MHVGKGNPKYENSMLRRDAVLHLSQRNGKKILECM